MMLRHRHPTGLVSGQQEIEARSLDMGEHRACNGGGAQPSAPRCQALDQLRMVATTFHNWIEPKPHQ
jgi:hypothetical protein